MPGSGSSSSLSCDFSVRITYSLVEKPNFRTSWQNNKAEINFYQERILAAIKFIWWQLKLIFFNLKDVPKSWLPAYFTNSCLTDKKAYSAFPWLHPCNLKVNIISLMRKLELSSPPPPPTPLRVVRACTQREIQKLNSIKITRMKRMFCVYFWLSS